MKPSDALREAFGELLSFTEELANRHGITREEYQFIGRMRAALAAPVSVADVIEENDQAHLQEIADGAWGDGPKTRGAAIAALRSQVVGS